MERGVQLPTVEVTTLEAVMASNGFEMLIRHAERSPDRMALVDVESREHTTYGQMADRARRYRAGLRQRGIEPGDRVVAMIRPDADFHALLFAIFAEGATAALVAPGTRLSATVEQVRRAEPRLMVVRRRTALAQWMLPDLWSCDVVVPSAPFGPFDSLDAWRDLEPVHAAPAEADAPAVIHLDEDQPYAVTHAELMIPASSPFGIQPGDVGSTPFPGVALRQLTAGATTILPPFDRRRPSGADGPRLVRTWRTQAARRVWVPPVLLQRAVTYLEQRDRLVDNVEEIVVAGPVSRQLARAVGRRFPAAQATAVYGPVASEVRCHVDLRTVAESSTRGYLIADALPSRLRIDTRTPDDGTRGSVGELAVRDDGEWRDTGDLVRLDDAGLWLVGRLADRVGYRGQPVAPYEVEHALTEVPRLSSAALVDGPAGPVLFYAGASDIRRDVTAVLRTHGFDDVEVRRIPTIPCGVAHQSRVDRSALRRTIWNPATAASL